MKLKGNIQKAILGALSVKPSTINELASVLGLSSDTIRICINQLKVNEEVYVYKRIDLKYAFARVHSCVNGVDAPTPDRKVARARNPKKIREMTHVPGCRQATDVTFRLEFMDELVFKIVAWRRTSC